MPYVVEHSNLATKFGDFKLYCFSWGNHEEENILVLQNINYQDVPLVRVQSACYTAEIFKSLDCDCHAQLSQSQRLISDRGGLLIYMLCDGRGAGLLNKIKGLSLGDSAGMDTSEAYAHLGLEQDPREYSRVVEILSHFSIRKVALLTNNPRKIAALEQNGINVKREPLEIKSTLKSMSYLKTKASKMGHMLGEFEI